MAEGQRRLVLVRHGETEWSKTGQHTGHSDLPLTDEGRRTAQPLRQRLSGFRFSRVLTSPLSRARETAAIAGFGEAEPRDELMEWDYGAYEGKTAEQIRRQRPGWNLWRDGVQGGEPLSQVGARADRILAELGQVEGAALIFSHGHLLRILAARALSLAPVEGRIFALGVASISILAWHDQRYVIDLWNWAG